MNFEEIFGELVFSLMIALFIYAPVVFIAILIMHFLMPRAVLERYFKPPFFREFECLFFSGIPFAPLRTVMFMRTIANPKSGEARGITEAHLLVKNWYRMGARIVMLAIYIGAIASIVFLIGGMVIYLLDEWNAVS